MAAARWQEQRLMRLAAAAGNAAAATAEAAGTAPAAAGAPAAAAPPAAAAAATDISGLDIRIGRVTKVERHPDADSLYVEQVEVGEAEPRTIVSGLVQFVPLEQMQDRPVVVLCNLQPRNMRGIKSFGMLLCASNDAHDAVEPLLPPEGAAVGERVWFGEEGKSQGPPAEPNRCKKKKIWETCQPDLKTGADRIANFQGRQMLTSAGAVTAASLTNANIS